MKVKQWCFIVATMLVMLSACGKKDNVEVEAEMNDQIEGFNATDMPIVDESIELEFFAGKHPSTADDWNDVLLFNKYKEKTNIDVKWDMVPHDSLDEKRNLKLSSQSLPDAFFGSGIPVGDIAKYGEQGMFIPLEDLIDDYAPNLKALLEKYPEVEKALTFPDGHIYSFPQMTDPEFLSMRMGPKPWINEKWLDELNMNMPKTLDEFYDYLTAVKEADLGENGTIPYGGPSITSLFGYLEGAFGLSNKGSENGTVDVEPGTDDLRFYPISDPYKELLEYVHKLYDEELIEQNIFSIEHSQYLANAMDGKYGSTVWYDMNQEAGGVLTGMPAMEGPNGDKMYSVFSAPTLSINTFLITSDNEHPEATIRWVDHWFGDEGMKEFFMGYEGETYEVNENGELEYMDHILNSEEGLTRDQEIAKYLTFPGGGYPGMLSQEYFHGSENTPDELEAAEKLEPNLVEDPWGAFIHTKEETDKLSSFGADIDKYVEEMRDKFISGDVSLEQWDEYVDTVQSMNLEEYMEIKEAAYDRYKDN